VPEIERIQVEHKAAAMPDTPMGRVVQFLPFVVMAVFLPVMRRQRRAPGWS
jgi:hypothetical protein